APDAPAVPRPDPGKGVAAEAGASGGRLADTPGGAGIAARVPRRSSDVSRPAWSASVTANNATPRTTSRMKLTRTGPRLRGSASAAAREAALGNRGRADGGAGAGTGASLRPSYSASASSGVSPSA